MFKTVKASDLVLTTIIVRFNQEMTSTCSVLDHALNTRVNKPFEKHTYCVIFYNITSCDFLRETV